MSVSKLSFNDIVKREIPQRRMYFIFIFGGLFIFIIISIIFLTKIFLIIGLLSSLILFFFYRSGSVYSTYKTMGITYFSIKQSEGGNNKEIIEKTILFRIKSFPMNDNKNEYLMKIMNYVDAFVKDGISIYSFDHLLIYITSLAIWMHDNNAADNPYFHKFVKQQFRALNSLQREE